MIKVVIFDIDDTFSLTEAVSFKIENSILKRMGRPPMSRKVHLQTWEIPLSKALAIRSPGTDLDAFKAAYWPQIAKYTKSGKMDVIPNANYQALDKLAYLDKSLMILSSRTHDQMIHLLQPSHPLAQRIQTFYYKDNLDYRKPDPRVFDDLLIDNNLLPEQCVYVGDSVGDAQSAKQAGLFFIASLESGLRQRKDFASITVDAFVDKFPDVVSAVQSLDDAAPNARLTT